jgi:ATP-dependent RNA helicase DDX27
LIKACNRLEYYRPTYIQEKAIPLILNGNDVLGCSITGSGKTAAYVLPLLDRAMKSDVIGTKALILVPTRELAVQCHSMIKSLAKYTNITSAVVIGGGSISSQEAELKDRPDIIIASPGRLIDHLTNSKAVTISSVKTIVLDEADKLLEMGFSDEINEILKHCSTKRQTLMFSATLSKDIAKLANIALDKPMVLNGEGESTCMQYVINLKDEDTDLRRECILLLLALKYLYDRTIIFANTKQEVHRLFILFSFFGIPSIELHGFLTQKQRLQAVQDFQADKAPFLIATDIAGRGIDIPQVSSVVNMGMPVQVERYTHRIGRTARAGFTGTAITICNEEERKVIKKIARKSKSALKAYSIKNTLLASIEEAVAKIGVHIEKLLEEEKVDRNMVKAEVERQKAVNMIEHSDEISNRPKKMWFKEKTETKKQKSLEKRKDLIRKKTIMKMKKQKSEVNMQKAGKREKKRNKLSAVKRNKK